MFSDDILKGENQKVISLETFDGKILENTKNSNEKDNFSVDDFNKNDRNSEFSDNSENITYNTFSSDENFVNNKNENSSKLDEIWNKINENSNKIVENNVENFETKDKFQTKKWKHNSNFKNYKNSGEHRNFDIINENTENKSYYKVGTFEKHVEKQFHYDILGQIFDTYILVRRDEELEIYDQHIIHERILYEELKDKFYNKKLESQHLLLPLKMGITGIEKNIIFENIEIFRDFGFDIDEFSENEIVIRAVPAFDFRDSIENVFLQLIMDLKNEVEIKDLRENIIISMSCKGAVKAGQRLDMFEMQNMVRRIHEVGKYTCPHGRPIIVKLSRNDLDKMFGRRK